MEFVKTIKVVLSEEEEKAIETVLHIFDSMWEQSENDEMEALWERYGSEDESWTCVDDTLRNLLNGGKII